jgi:glutamate dehydrogenase/leucine dehydrogenase
MTIEVHEDDGRRLYVARRGDRILGYVAIDSTVGGRARGGLRLVSDVEAEEIRDAAHAMTLKYGFLGLPQGGAKAGVAGESEGGPVEKRELLLEFGGEIKTLLEDRIYIPDADLGTSAGDIRWMMKSLGFKVAKQDWRENFSGFYTAVSCLASAEILLAHQNRTLSGQTVAIEGFGSVGANLARLMSDRGARVVAVSTSAGGLYDPAGLRVESLVRLAADQGSPFVKSSNQGESIDRASLLELEVDLLCPCARRSSIHRDNVSRIRTKLICAGANNPVESAIEHELFERGIVFPPDFVTNSGGVLGGTLQFAGLSKDRAARWIEQFLKDRMTEVLNDPASDRVPLRELIQPDALTRHQKLSAAADHPTLQGRILAFFLEAYRRGLIPKAMVSGLTPLYLKRLQGS